MDVSLNVIKVYYQPVHFKCKYHLTLYIKVDQLWRLNVSDFVLLETKHDQYRTQLQQIQSGL